MNYKKTISSRIIYTSLIILLQATWALLLVFRLSEYSAILQAALVILSLAMVLYVVNRNDNPDYVIVWIVLILLMPLFGGLLYLVYGNKKTSRRLKSRLEASHEEMSRYMKQDKDVMAELCGLDERVGGLCRYLEKASGYPVWKKTATRYYSSGEEMFPDMLEAIEKAEHYIFLESFIIEEGEMWGSILQQLRHKAEAGVEVRIIYDDIGCVPRLPAGYDRWLEALHPNIRCLAFNPVIPVFSLVMNHRSHQKILVVDGYCGFTGGINLADEYINKVDRFGYWKDSGIRLEGEAVWNLTSIFLELWTAFKGQEENHERFMPHVWHAGSFTGDSFVQPFSDTPLDNETVAHNVYLDLLSQSKRYVYLFTPYLILDYEMQSAFILAAKRGVDVRIVTPAIPDKKLVFRLTRSNYQPLLRGGVRIYECTPGFIHAKSFICDDTFGVVGTVNMDYRSLYLHFEDAVFLYRSESLPDIRKDAEETFKKSREITLDDLRTNLFGRLLDAVLRLVAPIC